MPTTPRLPPAALLMYPGLEALVLSTGTRGRLGAVVDLATPVPFPTPAEVPAEVEVLVTGWGCPVLGAQALAALPVLRLVAHAAGTVRSLVSDALWDRGIVVTSAASANAVPVAEFTFAAIIMITKDVFAVRDRHRDVRGCVDVVDQSRMGSRGRRIGLVGASTIGRLVIERLRSLDVEVVVADPYLTTTEATELGVALVDLDELLATSDVVSLHAPLLASTRHMIGADQLAAMRDGAWLLNTARGGLVDTDAITAELVSGGSTPSWTPPTPSRFRVDLRSTTFPTSSSHLTSPERWAARYPAWATWPLQRWSGSWPGSRPSTRSFGQTWTTSHDPDPFRPLLNHLPGTDCRGGAVSGRGSRAGRHRVGG